MTKHEFPVGVLWEDNPLVIQTDYVTESYKWQGTDPPCPHCHSPEQVGNMIKWTVPMVVVVENEGGFNSTGACVDCIREAAETIRQSK